MKTYLTDMGVYEIFCPGCGATHHIPTVRVQWSKKVFTFNGNKAAPTFIPSLDITWEADKKNNIAGGRCHFIVSDGFIRYAPDSTHSLAGHTVELPLIEPYKSN